MKPYRDNNGVLRCRHHRKLHLVCDDCEAEEDEVPELLHELLFWTRFLLMVGAAALGALGMLWYYTR